MTRVHNDMDTGANRLNERSLAMQVTGKGLLRILICSVFLSYPLDYVAAQVILAGDEDNFGNIDGPGDTIVMRDTFLQYMTNSDFNNKTRHGGVPMPFDMDTSDEARRANPPGDWFPYPWDWTFGYTFMNLPVLNKDAQLRVHLKANSDLGITDSLHLMYTGDGSEFRAMWGLSLPTLTGKRWVPEDGPMIVTLSLNNLDPRGGPTSLIDAINQAGYLDVFVQDDTAIDWIELTVPEPSSLLLLGVIFACGATGRARRWMLRDSSARQARGQTPCSSQELRNSLYA